MLVNILYVILLSVHVHVVLSCSYMMIILFRASMKLGLDRAVLQSMNSQNKDTSVVSG